MKVECRKNAVKRNNKLIIVTLTIMISIMFTLSVAVYAASSDDWFSKGNSYLKNKDYINAIGSYTQAIAIEPMAIGSYTNRSIAYLNMEKYDEAIADCSKALTINPNHITAYNNRSFAYSKKGIYNLAIDDLNRAIAINPSFWPNYDNRASICILMGMYDQAIEDCNTALNLNSNAADAYNVRGNAYRLKGLYEQALKDYNKALSLDPNIAEAYAGRGYIYAHNDMNEKATEEYKKANAIDTKALEQIEKEGRKNTVVNVMALKSPLVIDDFMLGGFSLAMTKEEFLDALGEPATIKQFNFGNVGGVINAKFTKNAYTGISVTTSDDTGTTWEIEVTDSKFKTTRGIGVGDSISKVKELYGKENQYLKSKTGELLFVYKQRMNPWELSFWVNPSTNLIGRIVVDGWSD